MLNYLLSFRCSCNLFSMEVVRPGCLDGFRRAEMTKESKGAPICMNRLHDNNNSNNTL